MPPAGIRHHQRRPPSARTRSRRQGTCIEALLWFTYRGCVRQSERHCGYYPFLPRKFVSVASRSDCDKITSLNIHRNSRLDEPQGASARVDSHSDLARFKVALHTAGEDVIALDKAISLLAEHHQTSDELAELGFFSGLPLSRKSILSRNRLPSAIEIPS